MSTVYRFFLPLNSAWMRSELAQAQHPALVVAENVVVPALSDETWEWLLANVRNHFHLFSVTGYDADEDDFIAFSDYQEFLHFKLRWAEEWGKL